VEYTITVARLDEVKICLSDTPVDTTTDIVEWDSCTYTTTLTGTYPLQVKELNSSISGRYLIMQSTVGTEGFGLANVEVHGTTISVSHNNITYGTVSSASTGRVWLDRNLGASRVCTELNDTACYGDYYQFGRDKDGHEDNGSATTTILADDVDTVGDGNFITNGAIPSDWASVDVDGAIRSTNWSKTDGTSICPTGYRVPTVAEFTAETTGEGINNNIDAFNSFLKLSSSGYRNNAAILNGQGSYGFYWTPTPDSNSLVASRFGFLSGSVGASSGTRVDGFTVRCIKD